ncbi:GerAB/ArcD/ProY family transporter [Bacillus sp. Marseille-P3661]|uniref:GerAB/ArcD/ProY family transporter n=1 Tax=Bacillus sp. Marseille-P3661 TaxID=1936234 RepID=UPI0015E18697|nr:endospore germination permease [Bacillus sp. Marseille-P3661]
MNQTPEKITLLQLGIIILLFSIGTSILLIPSGLATIAKQDAWLACLVSIGMGLLLIFFYQKLAKMFPNKTFVEYCIIILGKWVGIFVALMFVLFSFVGAATALFYQGDFVVTHVLPGTPIEMANLLFVLPVIMAVRIGIETIGRSAEILVPWVMLLFALLVIAILPQIEMTNIQPIYETGVKPIIHGALSFASIGYLPCIVFSMILPSVNLITSIKKPFYVSFFISGIFMAIITFLCITVLGAEYTARGMYPSYDLAKKINIGNFIQRIEALIAAIWFITTYFKVLIYFYAFVLGTAQIFGMKNYRPIVFPSAILLVALSYDIYPDTVYASEWNSTIWVPFTLTFGLFLPIALLVVAKIREKVKT